MMRIRMGRGKRKVTVLHAPNTHTHTYRHEFTFIADYQFLPPIFYHSLGEENAMIDFHRQQEIFGCR